MTESIDNFNLLIFNGYSTADGFPRIFSSSVNSVVDFKTYSSEASSKDGYIRYKYVSSTQIQITTGGLTGFKIYGIKI